LTLQQRGPAKAAVAACALRLDHRRGLGEQGVEALRPDLGPAGERRRPVERSQKSVDALLGAQPGNEVGRFRELGEHRLDLVRVAVEKAVRREERVDGGGKDGLDPLRALTQPRREGRRGEVRGIRPRRPHGDDDGVLQARKGLVQRRGALLRRQLGRDHLGGVRIDREPRQRQAGENHQQAENRQRRARPAMRKAHPAADETVDGTDFRAAARGRHAGPSARALALAAHERYVSGDSRSPGAIAVRWRASTGS
jgi:hypothetical protein